MLETLAEAKVKRKNKLTRNYLKKQNLKKTTKNSTMGKKT